MADCGAAPNAVPVGPLAGFGHADAVRGGAPLDRGVEKPTVRDTTALAVFPMRPIGIRQAIQQAVADDQSGTETRRTVRGKV